MAKVGGCRHDHGSILAIFLLALAGRGGLGSRREGYLTESLLACALGTGVTYDGRGV